VSRSRRHQLFRV